MLTRLRIQGFKNLLDIDVRFGPFTCIAGPNGAGKSNIFDAIRFLHLLVKHPIMEAVKLLRESRGRTPEPRSLLSTFGDYRASEIRLTAELIVRRENRDEFGVSAQAAISTVKYTVAFRLNEHEKPERLELVEESLLPIPLAAARKGIGFDKKKQFVESVVMGRRTVPFISTETVDGEPRIRVHQERHGGRMVPAPKSSWTVLGGLASSDFPTLLAVHREMESWQSLLLEPSAMRAPSYYSDPNYIDYRGAFLAATIERLRKSETKPGQTFAAIENRLSQLIEDVKDLRIVDDEKAETYTLEVCGSDNFFHAARSLSDGTLRFLVLATLAIDAQTMGLICLEEPENGIHPGRIPAMVDLLREIACDPNYEVGPENSMRQVIVNTHSPAVMNSVDPNDLVYVDRTFSLKPIGQRDSLELGDSMGVGESRGLTAEVMVPPKSWRAKVSNGKSRLSSGHILPYFEPLRSDLPEQLELDFFSE